MVERAQYEKELKDVGSEEEEDLQMFDEVPEEDQDEDESEDGEIRVVEKQSSKSKGKQKAVDLDDAMDEDSPVGTKRRRPRMDPFAGKDLHKHQMLGDSSCIHRIRR